MKRKAIAKVMMILVMVAMLMTTTGTLRAEAEASAIPWKSETGTHPVVNPEKDWRIEFSQEVEPSTANRDTIRVTRSTGEKVEASAEMHPVSGKVVTVMHPSGGYAAGETYTLHIGTGVRSVSEESLSRAVEMTFVIEEPAPEAVTGKAGSSKTIGANESEASLLERNVTYVQHGDTRIFMGYRQVSADNQDPVAVRFDNGERVWIRDDYETSGDDGRGYGLLWDGGDIMYGVFSATGTQGSPENDYRRFTRNGWLTSYGQGGGAKVAVIAAMNPETGDITHGTYLYARLNNGNTNSLEVKEMSWQNETLTLRANSWFRPLDVNRNTIDVSEFGGSPFDYTIVFNKELDEALEAYVQ